MELAASWDIGDIQSYQLCNHVDTNSLGDHAVSCGSGYRDCLLNYSVAFDVEGYIFAVGIYIEIQNVESLFVLVAVVRVVCKFDYIGWIRNEVPIRRSEDLVLSR